NSIDHVRTPLAKARMYRISTSGAPPSLCLECHHDAHGETEEGRPFEQSRDDDHGVLNAAGSFRLSGHALEGGAADAPKPEAGADQDQARANAGPDAVTVEGASALVLGECRTAAHQQDEHGNHQQSERLQLIHGIANSLQETGVMVLTNVSARYLS